MSKPGQFAAAGLFFWGADERYLSSTQYIPRRVPRQPIFNVPSDVTSQSTGSYPYPGRNVEP